jgi:hypothetical protein
LDLKKDYVTVCLIISSSFISTENIKRGFFLVGGVALTAYYWNHTYSTNFIEVKRNKEIDSKV